MIEALERINRFDAATIVGRWLSRISTADDAMAMDRRRGGSGMSERSSSLDSRRRGTSEASEHCDVRTRSTEGSNASEGSPQLGSRQSPSGSRVPFSVACPRHSLELSERSLLFGRDRFFSRDARASSHGSLPDASRQVQRLISSELKPRSSSSPSEHSCPTESSYCASSLERLSCEESQNGSTEQIVPQPRCQIVLDQCRSCQHCAPRLSLQETEGPKPCKSIQETSHAELGSMSNPIQISHGSVKEESSKEEMFSIAETGEPDVKSSFPLSSMLPELSSRLSLSWRPVAIDLGFRSHDLGSFEEGSLLRVQASRMLHCWLSKNICTLECKHCEGVILERLGEAFENVHRADLKDFLEHSKNSRSLYIPLLEEDEYETGYNVKASSLGRLKSHSVD